jgi:prepilin-type N-terminal cleavage/methylation domain-containing protein
MARRQRGFSVAEVLTVIVIVGLMMSVIAFSMPLFLRSSDEAQSQVDNVNTAALALYKMQHDVRPSNVYGVFTCNTAPIVSCNVTAPGPTPLPTAQAVVMLTADQGGLFQIDSNGNPKWQGFFVYWLTPNADGSSNELRRSFVPLALPIIPLNLRTTDAVAAVTAVLGLTGYTTIAQDVRTMSAAIDTTNSVVYLQVDGGDNKGNLSSLQLSGNSYVRN